MLNPRFYKNNLDNWTLEWDSDPQAVAYDIVLPDGLHIQSGKKATRANFGKTKPSSMPKIAAAHAGAYETPADPDAPPPVPVPDPVGIPRFGISPGYMADWSLTKIHAELDQCKAIGAEMIRTDYVQNAMSQTIVNETHARGMASVMNIFGTSRSPHTDPGPFPGQTATLWRDKLPLRIYEILNEPDLNGWTPDVYAQFAKACCDQIKAADSDAIIWCGGFFKGSGDSPSLRPQEFTKALCSHNVNFDGWSGHIFDGLDNWSDQRAGWHEAYPHGDYAKGYTVREILDANGRSHVPLVSSESHAMYSALGADGQANMIKAYVDFVKTGKIAAMCYYRMSYGETGKFDSSLLNPDGTKRPAWEALRQAMALA